MKNIIVRMQARVVEYNLDSREKRVCQGKKVTITKERDIRTRALSDITQLQSEKFARELLYYAEVEKYYKYDDKNEVVSFKRVYETCVEAGF